MHGTWDVRDLDCFGVAAAGKGSISGKIWAVGLGPIASVFHDGMSLTRRV